MVEVESFLKALPAVISLIVINGVHLRWMVRWSFLFEMGSGIIVLPNFWLVGRITNSPVIMNSPSTAAKFRLFRYNFTKKRERLLSINKGYSELSGFIPLQLRRGNQAGSGSSFFSPRCCGCGFFSFRSISDGLVWWSWMAHEVAFNAWQMRRSDPFTKSLISTFEHPTKKNGKDDGEASVREAAKLRSSLQIFVFITWHCWKIQLDLVWR